MYFVEDEKIAENLQRSLNTGAGEKENFELTDPRLEYHDPTPNIHELFALLDKRYFWGELGMVEVKWSRRMTTSAGLCYYHGKSGLCCIKLSAPLLSLRPRKDLVETLLHEMIHAYLFVTEDEVDREDHGPRFRRHMRRINKEAGTEITVYHTFDDEVAYYQKHIWRCSGKCRDKRPFFGFVRRATNRAPGPADSWWREHQKNCGGDFVKVSEPEKRCKKTVKRDKGDTVKNTAEARGGQVRRSLESSAVSPSTSHKGDLPDARNKKPVRDLSHLRGSGARGARTPDRDHFIKPETGAGRAGACKATCGDEEEKSECSRVRDTVRRVWANKYLPPGRGEQEPSGPDVRSPITVRMKGMEVRCPVCYAPFSEALVNEHVEECLSKAECAQIVYETVREKERKKRRSRGPCQGGTGGELVPCPVCGRVLHGKDLNEHLEACVNFNFGDADSSPEDDGTERVPCPCCLKWVPEKSMNDHVRGCLSSALGGSPKSE